MATAAAVGGISGAITPASAETNAADNPDEIIVSALRTPAARSETGASVTVITAEDIAARQYALLSDALRDAAGVAIARNGGAGGVASARLRGAASGQTLVVIDGVVANDPSAPQGGFNFATLDAADIERIEILRGPQSLLYGADAIGGVIVVTTKRAGASAFIEGGSFATVRGNAAAGFEDGDRFGRISFTGSHTDGVSRADGGAEADGYRNLALSAAGGLALNENWRAELIVRASDARTEIDGFPAPAFVLADTTETEKTQDILLAAKLHQTTNRFDNALSLSYTLIDRENRDQGALLFDAKGRRLTADYLCAWRLNDRWRVIGGAEIESTGADVSGVDENATAGAVFALAEVKPAPGVTLSGGVRRDEFSNFEGATTARVSAVWNAPHGVILRANWGEGFRAPSLFELNFDQFGVIPNPDLRPERATGFDAGIEKRFGAAARQRISVTFFRTRVRDHIAFDSAGAGYFNIAEARSRGVEAEAAFVASSAFSLDLNYTYSDAIDVALDTQLLRQPKHKATAVATIAPTDRLSLSATGIFNGRENDIPASNDSFLRLDLRAAYAATDRLEIYGRIENATDADYQDISGYGEAGAAAYVGLRTKL